LVFGFAGSSTGDCLADDHKGMAHGAPPAGRHKRPQRQFHRLVRV